LGCFWCEEEEMDDEDPGIVAAASVPAFKEEEPWKE
jgi:hypothetical protein